MNEDIKQFRARPEKADEHNLKRVMGDILDLSRDEFQIFYNNLRTILQSDSDNLRFETNSIVFVISSKNAWRVLRILNELPKEDGFKKDAIESLMEDMGDKLDNLRKIKEKKQ